MLLEDLNSLDEAKLHKLCDEACPESNTLDFKRSLPSSSDRDKSEFLKDICAFANSEGGDLVYGIEEADGVANKLTPIATEPADTACRRLRQILDAGLEPRHSGITFHVVQVSEGYILVIRVLTSFDGPHRYIYNNHSRFVMRSGTHTTELTYDQLRVAFDRTATLAEKARNFRDSRIDAIVARKTWKPIVAGPICVLHLIPISSMSGRRSIDIRALHNNYTTFILSDWGGGSRTLNLDGLVVHPGYSKENSEMYTFNQVFRSGAIEALRYGGLTIDPDRHFIPSTSIANFFRESTSRFIEALKSLGFTGPAIISSALLFIGDYQFALSNSSYKFADREHLILPEHWVDNLESITNIDTVIQPMLDVLWQSFGIERCTEYDRDGNWYPK